MCNSAEKGDERLCAAHFLADCCGGDGKHADAERINRARRWVLGEEHSATLTSDLASSLSGQGKYAEAERIEREVLGVLRRVLGEERPSTLSSANNLASSLSDPGRYMEAERIEREVLGVLMRVLG